MKLGINLYLWADHMHDGLSPVLETLKEIGYDGVEVRVLLPGHGAVAEDHPRVGQRARD